MLSDPQFWVAIAFVIFLIAIFNPIKKILGSTLDSKINEIKDSIEEAENIKNDTLVALNDIKNRQNEVDLEIKKINANAKEKINVLELQTHEKLVDQISKKESLAKEKIEQMVRDTNLIIKENIAQTAIEATINILEKKLNQNEKQNLIDQSIKELGEVLKN